MILIQLGSWRGFTDEEREAGTRRSDASSSGLQARLPAPLCWFFFLTFSSGSVLLLRGGQGEEDTVARSFISGCCYLRKVLCPHPGVIAACKSMVKPRASGLGPLDVRGSGPSWRTTRPAPVKCAHYHRCLLCCSLPASLSMSHRARCLCSPQPHHILPCLSHCHPPKRRMNPGFPSTPPPPSSLLW